MTLSTWILVASALVSGEPIQQSEGMLYSDDIAKVRLARDRLKSASFSSFANDGESARRALSKYEAACVAFFGQLGNDTRSQSYRRQLSIISHSAIQLSDMPKLFFSEEAESITICSKGFTDKHLRFISGFNKLGILTIVRSSVEGVVLRELSLPELAVLHFVDCPVGDDAACAIRFPKLDVLGLEGTHVTNKTLSGAPWTSVRALVLYNTKVDAGGMKSLSRFPLLRELRIDLKDFSEDIFDLDHARRKMLLVLRCQRKEVGDVEAISRRAPNEWNVKSYVPAQASD